MRMRNDDPARQRWHEKLRCFNAHEKSSSSNRPEIGMKNKVPRQSTRNDRDRHRRTLSHRSYKWQTSSTNEELPPNRVNTFRREPDHAKPGHKTHQ